MRMTMVQSNANALVTVVGDDESEIMKLIRTLPKETDKV